MSEHNSLLGLKIMDILRAFCGPQRSAMRFPAVAVRSKTAAGKELVVKG